MIKEISAKFGYTMNMGNYESARIDIGLVKTVKIEFEEEAINESMKLISMLEEKVMDKVKQDEKN